MKKCNGAIKLHNDGRDFICMGCGKVFPRSRGVTYPDTEHYIKVKERVEKRNG